MTICSYSGEKFQVRSAEAIRNGGQSLWIPNDSRHVDSVRSLLYSNEFRASTERSICVQRFDDLLNISDYVSPPQLVLWLVGWLIDYQTLKKTKTGVTRFQPVLWLVGWLVD